MRTHLTLDEMLNEQLADMEDALYFLQAAMEDADLEHFIDAFGRVVRAQGGVAKFASKTSLTRQTIYNVLRNKNLRAGNLWELMRTLGLRFDIVPLGKKTQKPVFARLRRKVAKGLAEAA